MNASQLEIRLLGTVEVVYDHKPIKIPRRVERGILYYLTVENCPVGRSRLIDLLWPQADQVDPRGTLRTALSRLRNKLPDVSLLITELDMVSLDFDRCNVDLLQFENAYQSLKGIIKALPENKPLPVQIVNQISQALDLWQGDGVILGEDLNAYPELEAWRQTVDKNLSQHREALLKRLAEHYQACGQLESALDVFIHLGRINHLDLNAHLSVLDTLTKLGRYQESLEFCDALEVIFEREFYAPLPEEILKCCQNAQMLVAAHQRKDRLEWPIPPSMHLPLVGRTTELGQLRQAYFRGGLIIIQGEIGAGKTRLVQELFEILSPRPLLILAPAREIETSLPFAPIIHGLRRHIPVEVWGELNPVWANQLVLLFPELTEIRKDCSLTEVTNFPSARQHMFDALHHLLCIISRKYGRVLFFLDDAHWADRQTLQALSYLVLQEFFDENGVLVLATRLEDPCQDIDEMVEQFHHTHHVQVINLPGLNPAELGILVQQTLNQAPSTAFIEQLYRDTDGNPFLALEILRHVLGNPESITDQQNIEQLPLPASIHSLILSRLNHLSDNSRYILTCTALIGNDVSVDLLQVVSGIPQHEFLIALDPLLRSGFLRVNQADHGKEGNLFFSHEKMREVVIKDASHAHRQILHLRIAHQLTQDPYSLENAAVIADHYLAAGHLPNGFEWLLKAAARAWSFGASEDVLRVYQRAEDLVKNDSSSIINQGRIFQLYQQWSNYAYQSNQVDMLEAVGVKLQYYARLENEPQFLGVSDMVLANACFLREDFETGLLLIQKAIMDLERAEDPKAIVQALFHQTLFQWWRLDFEGALETTNRMCEVIENSGSGSQHVQTYQFTTRRMISETYSAQGEANKALPVAQAAYREYFDKLDTFDKLRANHMMAYVNLIAGHVDDCIRFAQKGVEILQKLDNTFFEGLMLITLSKAEILQGHLDEAYQHASQALKFAERNNKIQTIVAAHNMLGDIFVILRNYTQAMQHYRIAQVRQGFFFQSYYGLENNIRLGRLLTWTGELAEAREMIQTTLDVTEQKGMAHLHLQALMIDGLGDLVEQKLNGAEEKFLSIIDIATQKGLIQEACWGKFLMARLALSRHQFDCAEQYLLEVLEITRSNQMILLGLFTMELFWELNRFDPLRNIPEDLQKTFDALVDELEAHTRSAPLRHEFIIALQYWRGEKPLP